MAPAMVMRAEAQGGALLRPYGHAYAIRETLDLLLRTFPIRTCSDAKLQRHQRLGRPCCSSTSRSARALRGEVDREHYDRLVAELIQFLDGDTSRSCAASRTR